MTSRLAIVLVLLLTAVGVADEKPKPKRAFIGVMIGMDKNSEKIIILTVLPDSPAKKAGLKENDVLVSVNGAKPATLQAAVQVIVGLKPGKKAKLEIIRDGKKKEIEVVPAEMKE